MDAKLVFVVLLGVVVGVYSKPMGVSTSTSDREYFDMLKASIDSLNKQVLVFKDALNKKRSAVEPVKKEVKDDLELSLEKAVAEDAALNKDVPIAPVANDEEIVSPEILDEPKKDVVKPDIPELKSDAVIPSPDEPSKKEAPNSFFHDDADFMDYDFDSTYEQTVAKNDAKVKSAVPKPKPKPPKDATEKSEVELVHNIKKDIKDVMSSLKDMKKMAADQPLDANSKSKLDTIKMDIKNMLDQVKEIKAKKDAMVAKTTVDKAAKKDAPKQDEEFITNFMMHDGDAKKDAKVAKPNEAPHMDRPTNDGKKEDTIEVTKMVHDVRNDIKGITASFHDMKNMYADGTAGQALDESTKLKFEAIKMDIQDVMDEFKQLKGQFSAMRSDEPQGSTNPKDQVKSVMNDMKKQLKDASSVIKVLKDQALAKKKKDPIADMSKPEENAADAEILAELNAPEGKVEGKVADVVDDRNADEKLMALRLELSDVLHDLKVTKDNVAKESASEKREVETKSKKSLDELKKELDEIKDEVKQIKAEHPGA